jgi:hypothetical protein
MDKTFRKSFIKKPMMSEVVSLDHLALGGYPSGKLLRKKFNQELDAKWFI